MMSTCAAGLASGHIHRIKALVAQKANKYKVQYNPNGGVGELVNEDWVCGETKILRLIAEDL